MELAFVEAFVYFLKLFLFLYFRANNYNYHNYAVKIVE